MSAIVRGLEAVDIDPAATTPASAFTAAMWHLGVRCPNRDESDWFHHHRPEHDDLASGQFGSTFDER
jgi:hypothetical protein